MNKILLVDDDKHANEAIAATLRILGFSAYAVPGGVEAARHVAVDPPDMAIVDLNLHAESGLDVIASLQNSAPQAHCCLATGVADYSILKRALAAGAWTLMNKPFTLADLNAVIRAAAVLQSGRHLSRTMRETVPRNHMTITRRGDTPVNSEDIARTIRFAEQHGAAEHVARRFLPAVAYELMLNARTHGARESSEGWYRLRLEDDDSGIRVSVADSGCGFAWKKELARARTSWDKCKATGLQLTTALCDDIVYSMDEHTVLALLPWMSDEHPVVFRETTAEHE